MSALATSLQRVPRQVWVLLALAGAIVLPFLLEGRADGFLGALVTTFAYAIMALGLNVVVGFAGLLDLGYVAFYAIGAFVMGWFGSQQFFDINDGNGIHILTKAVGGLSNAEIPGIHINFFLAVLLAMAITGVWGVILGAPTLRLRGDYLAIVTLAFGEIVPRIFENGTSGLFGIGSTDFSNGRQGITPIDKINWPWSNETLNYPLDLTGSLVRPGVYFVALVMLVATIFFNIRLRDSRLGRAWIAVREDEVAASAMGVNLVRTKLWAYAIGAAIGGAAGAFLGTYNNTVNVDQFEFGFSVFVLAMVIVGGMGNIWGVLVGAFALSMIDKYLLSALDGVSQDVLNFDVTQISFGIFGFMLLAMMVLRPEGLIPSRRRRLELHDDDEDGLMTTHVQDFDAAYDTRQA